MSAEDAITKKIGPLPAWAWAGAVVVLVLVFRHFYSTDDATEDNIPDPAQADLTDPTNDPVGDPFAGGGFTGDTGGSGGGDVAEDPTDTGLNDVLGAIADNLTGIGEAVDDINTRLPDPSTDEPKRHHRTKAQWGMQSVTDVAGHGHTPIEVETAVWRYLHHKPLSAEQRKIVNIAIRRNGPPPGGVIPVKKAAPPPKPHKKEAPKRRHKKRHPHKRAA